MSKLTKEADAMAKETDGTSFATTHKKGVLETDSKKTSIKSKNVGDTEPEVHKTRKTVTVSEVPSIGKESQSIPVSP